MNTDQIIDGLIDALANIKHAGWANWQRYLHRQEAKQPDGSLVISAELVEHWEPQIGTPHKSLTENQKGGDR